MPALCLVSYIPDYLHLFYVQCSNSRNSYITHLSTNQGKAEDYFYTHPRQPLAGWLILNGAISGLKGLKTENSGSETMAHI